MNYLLCIITFCLFKYTAGFTDPLRKHYRKNFAKYKSLPKSWAMYIDSIIKKAFIQFKFINYQSNILDIVSFANLYLKFNQEEIYKCLKDDSLCLPKLLHFSQLSSFTDKIDVLQPVGSLCFDSPNKYLPREIEIFKVLNTWIFHLDPKLGLNLTILHINIVKTSGPCLRGRFLIKNFIRKELNYFIFSYCGRHPAFNHYSSSREILLSVQFFMVVTVEFSLLYSVMSANVIFNRAVVKHQSSFKLIQHLNILNRIIFSYHIQASKINHVCVHIKQNETLTFSVVDSPYYVDIWIDLRTDKFCGSTFQILLQAFSFSKDFDKTVSNVIRYYEKFPMEQYFPVNISKAQSLIIPNKYCQKVRFCI